MNNMFRLSVILGWMTCHASASGQVPFDDVGAGLRHIYSMRFDSARQTFDRMIRSEPSHPKGYFLKTSVSFYQLISGGQGSRLEEEFLTESEEAVRIADAYRQSTGSDMEADFYTGAVYGNLGRLYAAKGEWTKGFYYGRKAKSLHESVLRRDSTQFDAYLGIGLYNYYAATVPKLVDVLVSLLGLGGNKQEGIRQIRLAAQKGSLTGIESKFYLAGVYSEEGNYEGALALLDELCGMFPRNPYVLAERGVTKYRLEDYADSQLDFEKAIRTAESGYPSVVMTSHYFLGRIGKMKNDAAFAIAHFREAYEIGEKLNLFRFVDGWVVGASYFHLAETLELAGKRQFSVQFYELGKNHPMSNKGIVKGCKDRLSAGLSEFEIEYVHARNDVRAGNGSRSDSVLSRLDAEAALKSEWKKFRGPIRYYRGRVALEQRNFVQAAEHLELAIAVKLDGEEHAWLEPHARYYLGLCKSAQNLRDAARAEWKAAAAFADYPEDARIRFLCQQHLASK